MLNAIDEHWLNEVQPGLTRDGDAIVGSVAFRAIYQPEVHRFEILGRDAVRNSADVVSAIFRIRIEARKDAAYSRLPSLFVEGIDPNPDRHFNQNDKSACLCSPLDEDDFLDPEFNFQQYLCELVIPFLYGQVYFSQHGRWPWPDYAHGAVGILEAYEDRGGAHNLHECLRRLRQDSGWERIRRTLLQSSPIKGHTCCFCSRGEKIRRCHPKALLGARRLQRDIAILKVSI